MFFCTFAKKISTPRIFTHMNELQIIQKKRNLFLDFAKAFAIILVVIGVITGILLPTAIQSTPDKNVMKFKKGYNTLGQVIRELVTSDKYYKDGDLGIMSNGDKVVNPTYFCETFADVVSIKSYFSFSL